MCRNCNNQHEYDDYCISNKEEYEAKMEQSDKTSLGTKNDNDEYYVTKKQFIISQVSNQLTILDGNLTKLNTNLKDSLELGKQFSNISQLWNTFYDYEKQLKEITKTK